MNEVFDLWVYNQGYQIVLTDVHIDRIIREEGGSHTDGSQHEYESAMAPEGLIQKCTLCGQIKQG